MAWTTPRTWLTGEVVSKANLDAQIRDNLTHLKVNISLEAAVELTIAAGSVTKTRSHHTIDTQADAATDDLDTINGGEEGEVLIIRPSDGARTVVLKHNTGNIWSPVAQDLSLADADSYALLVYSGSKWGIIGGSGQVQISGTPEHEDIAVFVDHDTLEGLSVAEFLILIGVEAGATKYPDTGEQAFLDADHSKLDGIEALADVTDATNVAAAGAVMESDTTTALMQFVIDEDTMVSNLATKVPTQQSVKAYMDAQVALAITDYCFVVMWLPVGYSLYWEDSTGEVAIRKEITPDSNPGVTLFNGFNVSDGELRIWL